MTASTGTELGAWRSLELLQPWWLLLLALVPLAFVLRLRGRAALRFAPAALFRGVAVPRPPRSLRTRLASLPLLLRAAAILLGVLALARPAVRTVLPGETSGVDVLLCLDTSSSMAARDMEERESTTGALGSTRLELAKRAAAEFVSARPDDRIGLLAFARFSDLICPTTTDHAALLTLLAGIDLVQTEGDEDLTGLGAAAAQASARLATSPSTARVAILLTDGAESVADATAPAEIDPVEAGRIARDAGVRVHAVAVGTSEDADLVRGRDDLRTLAESTGGSFARAADATALREVYARIDRLERVPLPDPVHVLEDRFAVVVAFALGLALLARVVELTFARSLP